MTFSPPASASSFASRDMDYGVQPIEPTDQTAFRPTGIPSASSSLHPGIDE
jgi:hypothetical protein